MKLSAHTFEDRDTGTTYQYIRLDDGTTSVIDKTPLPLTEKGLKQLFKELESRLDGDKLKTAGKD